MANAVRLRIAGVGVAVRCADLRILAYRDAAHAFFLEKDPSPGPPDMEVVLEVGPLPDLAGFRPIFDSGNSWSMSTDGQETCIELRDRTDRQSAWVARFNPEVTRVVVHCGESLIRREQGGVLNPFAYPLDQLLLMYRLATRGGLVVHAAGIVSGGKGYAFPGRSGAGKSTLSRLLQQSGGADLLSDDRVILSGSAEAWAIHGTPWPGEAGIAANRSAPLSGIVFIAHGQANRVVKINSGAALEKLLPLASIPWFDPRSLPGALRGCERLLAAVPAFELTFRPDAEVARRWEELLA